MDFDDYRKYVNNDDLFDDAKNVMNEMAVRNGFADANELMRMITSIDLSDMANLVEYKVWQLEDGSKAGLLALFPQLAKLANPPEGEQDA